MTEASLHELIKAAPKIAPYARDPVLDAVSNEILTSDTDAQRTCTFYKWLSKNQPCLFGRLAASGHRELAVNITWLTESDIAQGDAYLQEKIQSSRRAWKDHAEQGMSHGFLVMFSSPDTATLAPSPELVQICLRLGDLYLPEARPVSVDTIYTEAVPLRGADGLLRLFKGGINIFYTGAHGSMNHDGRIPGGMMISTNSPGHYANSLVLRGIALDITEATAHVYNLALRSVGNGGIDSPNGASCTWHQHIPENSSLPDITEELHKKLPQYVPMDFDREKFAGNYHTDILVPRTVTESLEPAGQDWRWENVFFDFYTPKAVPFYHPNFGQWNGVTVPDEAKYFNPWHPEKPENIHWSDTPFWSAMVKQHPDLVD